MIPLDELAEIRYLPGPQAIKSEDTFLTGYVLFDKKPGHAEVDDSVIQLTLESICAVVGDFAPSGPITGVRSTRIVRRQHLGDDIELVTAPSHRNNFV